MAGQVSQRSPLAIIFVTVMIDLIGFGIVIPVLPLYAERFGASPTVVGLLFGIYSIMQFLFAPALGRLSDRVGRRPVLLLSLIGTAIGFLLMGLATTLWLLFVARAIDGITGGNISTAQAYIADVTGPEERSRGMGLIGAAFGIGFVFGPALAGILSHIDPAAPFYFAGALAAANALALYFFLPESLPSGERRSRRRNPTVKLSENRRLVSIAAIYFLVTVSFALMTATYSLFTKRRFAYDQSHNGYIFAYLGLIGAAIQGGLLGRLIGLLGDELLAIAGIALMAAGLFLLPLSSTCSMLIIASSSIAIGHSLSTPTLNGLASKSTSSDLQGAVFGAMQSVASLARIIGPSMGGWLLDQDTNRQIIHFGRTPFWAGSAVMVLAMAIALWSIARDGAERSAA
jgi:DHA1 family tetracycline resistance protein-like MFS transporter